MAKRVRGEDFRRQNLASKRQKQLDAQEIGKIPSRANRRQWEKTRRSFRAFCEAYFPDTFALDWSEDHLRVMAKIEQSVREGGLFAMAMPRGSGKTTLCECACLWAILTGLRSFVCLVGADQGSAVEMLNAIKTELEVNELLCADYSYEVYPITLLEGEARRAGGQRLNGERTHVEWRANAIAFPVIPKSKAAGAVVRVAGLTGRIRGLKHKRSDGTPVRPDLVILDDPQTDESANSESQCATREAILSGAILGLAGPGKKISGIMPCTVIRPGDVADNLLDPLKHPEWNGERTRMLHGEPERQDLWDQYAELQAESFRRGRGGKEATEFYGTHQADMDLGLRASWAQRHNPDELSAIQHALNIKIRDPLAFAAEFQNDPIDQQDTGDILTADEIASKTNAYSRGVIPETCSTLTAMIDVHKQLLYWCVCGWEDDFTGYVIDYDTWPQQRRSYFTLRDAQATLERAAAKQKNAKLAGWEGWLWSGLDVATAEILGRAWPREDGAPMNIDVAMVDANWGQATDLVYDFCRQTPFANVLHPSHGKYVGASSKPFSEYQRKPGDRVGLNWRMPALRRRRSNVRHVTFDANFWKSHAHARLSIPMGGRGCLSLNDTKRNHRMLAEHLAAEYPVRTEGRGRVVDEWQGRPGEPDNHYLDCLVGCCVAASIRGVTLPGMEEQTSKRNGKPMKLSEIQAKKRGLA